MATRNRRAASDARDDLGFEPYSIDRRAERTELREMQGPKVDPAATALLRRAVGDPFGGAEINYQTHQGYAPQRPAQIFEGQLNRIAAGWASIEELQQDLEAKGEGGLYKGSDGLPVRIVPRHTGSSVMNGGVLYHEVVDEERHIALTQADARAASQAGIDTDFWNGWSWMRRGLKPEKDFAVMYSRASLDAGRMRLERASVHDHAVVDPQAGKAISLAGLRGDDGLDEATRAKIARADAHRTAPEPKAQPERFGAPDTPPEPDPKDQPPRAPADHDAPPAPPKGKE